jgi:hypothetical protein
LVAAFGAAVIAAGSKAAITAGVAKACDGAALDGALAGAKEELRRMLE